MKIKITKRGFLKIFRRNEYRLMSCPFSPDEDYCADLCPLFNIEYKGVISRENGNEECYELQLCHKKYEIESVEYE